MNQTHHLSTGMEFLDGAILLKNNFQATGGVSKIGYLPSYCVLINLSLEHILKSFLSEDEVEIIRNKNNGHNLDIIFTEILGKKILDVDSWTKTVIHEINQYGYPVNGSERYPKVGYKSFYLDDKIIEKAQEFIDLSRERLRKESRSKV